NGVGQRRQQPIHHLREALRIVLVEFRNASESSHIAEHDRHDALFTAEYELVGILRKLGDQGRGEVLTESGTDALAIKLLADVVDEHQGGINAECGYQRERHIEQYVVLMEQEPRDCNQPNGYATTEA